MASKGVGDFVCGDQVITHFSPTYLLWVTRVVHSKVAVKADRFSFRTGRYQVYLDLCAGLQRGNERLRHRAAAFLHRQAPSMFSVLVPLTGDRSINLERTNRIRRDGLIWSVVSFVTRKEVSPYR